MSGRAPSVRGRGTEPAGHLPRPRARVQSRGDRRSCSAVLGGSSPRPINQPCPYPPRHEHGRSDRADYSFGFKGVEKRTFVRTGIGIARRPTAFQAYDEGLIPFTRSNARPLMGVHPAQGFQLSVAQTGDVVNPPIVFDLDEFQRNAPRLAQIGEFDRRARLSGSGVAHVDAEV